MLPAKSTLALEDLGWSSFQDLAIAVCEDILNTQANTFSPTRDMGIDGIVEPIRGRGTEDSVVIQAKHTSVFELLSKPTLLREMEKLVELSANFPISTYILVTNYRVGLSLRVAFSQHLQALGIKRGLIIGRENIVRRIRKSPKLRGMVPRLYGIGDLSQIIDERRIAQSSAILSTLRYELDKFVTTESYRLSIGALREHNILILLGDPAVGKSTIARCLAMAAIDEFSCAPVILNSFDEIANHWNPDDEKRLFWIDDAFGSTQLDQIATESFNKNLTFLNAAIKQGNKIILTSRSYIWNLSRSFTKIESLSNYISARVEIDVKQFTEFERAQIVYNHLQFGDQAADWIQRFRGFLPSVVRHRNFKPEVARRLGTNVFTGQLRPLASDVDQFVKNPAAFLEGTIQGFDDATKGALSAVLMAGGALASPIETNEAVTTACRLFSCKAGEIARRLRALEGPFFRLEDGDDGDQYWRFSHPTIGEATATVATSSPELLDVYLDGAPVRRMIREVCCVGRHVQGAIIKVGKSRFTKLAERLKTLEAGDYDLILFLAWRSTRDFRQTFFDGNTVRPLAPHFSGRMLLNRPCIELISLLLGDGLCSDELRHEFIRTAKAAIIEDFDPEYLSHDIQTIMGESAFSASIETIWHALKTAPSLAISDLYNNIEDDSDPDTYFSNVIDYFEELKTFFPTEDHDLVQGTLFEAIDEAVAEIFVSREMKEEERLREQQDDGRDLDEKYYSYMSTLGSPSRPHRSVQQNIFRVKPDPIVQIFNDLRKP
jgi:hypothetical protein